ncbi:MAG: glycosyltransferase family 4 protein [Rhodospirillales bacterium]|nr:glycosyltransferase family 4 protein [Rhodospirillales bacterium]
MPTTPTDNEPSAEGISAVLTAHHLSAGWREKLNAVIGGEIEVLVLRDLRKDQPVEMIRKLRAARYSSVYIACEIDESRSLVPILKVFSLFLGVGKRFALYPDLSVEKVSFLDGLAAGVSICKTFVYAKKLSWRAARDAKMLLDKPRKPMPGRTFKKGLYIKANPSGAAGVGGAVAHTAGVLNGFDGIGVKMTYASMEDTPGVNPGIEVAKAAPPETSIPPLRRLGASGELNLIVRSGAFVDSGREILASSSHDFIYQRMSLNNYAGVLLSREFNLPLVLEYNGSEVWIAEHWANGLVKRELSADIEAASLRHAHIVVTISEALQDDLLKRGVEQSRIVTYPNCVDPDKFSPDRFSAADIRGFRKRFGIPEGSMLLTFVGTFGPWHGAEIFADAITQLLEHDQDLVTSLDIRFLFVGDGVRRSECERRISGAARDRTYFVGLLEQTAAPLCLAASDILISPHVENADGSAFFGSPTKLFEYMAACKPIIASRLGQIADVMAGSPDVSELGKAKATLPDTASGILVAPGDASDLRRAIVCLANNREWRERLGQQARNLVLSKYTWSDHVRAIYQAMERI